MVPRLHLGPDTLFGYRLLHRWRGGWTGIKGHDVIGLLLRFTLLGQCRRKCKAYALTFDVGDQDYHGFLMLLPLQPVRRQGQHMPHRY